MKMSLKRIWKKGVEEESMKVGLSNDDVLFQPKWIVGINLIATGLGIWPPSVFWTLLDLKQWCLSVSSKIVNVAF